MELMNNFDEFLVPLQSAEVCVYLKQSKAFHVVYTIFGKDVFCHHSFNNLQKLDKTAYNYSTNESVILKNAN